MNVIADTNVLVRLIVADDPRQAEIARALFQESEKVSLPLHALCELCWVLRSKYKLPTEEIHHALTALLGFSKSVFDTQAVNAGLAMLAAGGDFADGVIAYEGARLGGDTFYSFDKHAVSLLSSLGIPASLLA